MLKYLTEQLDQQSVLDEIRGDRRLWEVVKARPARTISDASILSLSFDHTGDLLFGSGTDFKLHAWPDWPNEESTSHAIPTPFDSVSESVIRLGNGMIAMSSSESGSIAVTPPSVDRCYVLGHVPHCVPNRLICSPLDPHVFFAGCSDGWLRRFDVRDAHGVKLASMDGSPRLATNSSGQLIRGGRPINEDHLVIPFYQSQSILSLAIARDRPYSLALGGEQPFVWLVDLRMHAQSDSCQSGTCRKCRHSQHPLAQFMPNNLLDNPRGVYAVALDSSGSALAAHWQGDGTIYESQISVFDTSLGVERFKDSRAALQEPGDTTAVCQEEISTIRSSQTWTSLSFLDTIPAITPEGRFGQEKSIFFPDEDPDESTHGFWRIGGRTGFGSDGAVAVHPRKLLVASASI